MVEDLDEATKAFRRDQMRDLSDADRAAAIDAASNVLGFDRFCDRARQVQLRREYRRTFQGTRR